MEYRDKHFSVVQGFDGNWKWLVSDLVGHTRTPLNFLVFAGFFRAMNSLEVFRALGPGGCPAKLRFHLRTLLSRPQ